MSDISREAVERIAHNADCNGHFGAAEALFALRAALDAAEADKRQAVMDERERCAAKVERDQWPTFGDSRRIAAAIRALPAPTSAQLRDEAMMLPEIAALVEAAQACVHTSPPHESHVALESALAAIKEATQ